MSAYILRITINKQVTLKNILTNQSVKLEAQENAQYELLDSNGEIIQPQLENGNLSWLSPQTQQPIVIVENYSGTVSTSQTSLTPEMATLSEKEVITASEIGITKPILLGAGILGGLATSVAFLSKKSSSNRDNPSKPSEATKNYESNIDEKVKELKNTDHETETSAQPSTEAEKTEKVATTEISTENREREEPVVENKVEESTPEISEKPSVEPRKTEKVITTEITMENGDQ